MLRVGRRAYRRGTATVEFALLLPFLVALVLGTLEIGRMVDVQQVLSHAAGEGGRQAAVGGTTNAQTQQIVLNALQASGLPTKNITVTVRNLTHPGIDASSAAQLDELEVTVTIPNGDVTWVNSHWFAGPTAQIQVKSLWVSARGQVYPTDIQVPPGY